MPLADARADRYSGQQSGLPAPFPREGGTQESEFSFSNCCCVMVGALVMGESRTELASAAIGKRGSELHHGAIHCTGIHAAAARGMWPKKTAENWASRAGVKIRMAKYWLSGKPVSEAGKLALIRELD